MSALVSLRLVTKAIAERLAFVSPLLSRLVIGVVFTHSGWGKWHHLDQVAQFFASLGVPFPTLQAPFVASVELGCGALVLAGLAARFAAFPLIGTMVVALTTALASRIDGVNALFGLAEFLYIVLLAQLAIGGAGPVSLDRFAARWLDARAAAERS
jgi:putative oxidoreductase